MTHCQKQLALAALWREIARLRWERARKIQLSFSAPLAQNSRRSITE
jgi:hypothetical protein